LKLATWHNHTLNFPLHFIILPLKPIILRSDLRSLWLVSRWHNIPFDDPSQNSPPGGAFNSSTWPTHTHICSAIKLHATANYLGKQSGRRNKKSLGKQDRPHSENALTYATIIITGCGRLCYAWLGVL